MQCYLYKSGQGVGSYSNKFTAQESTVFEPEHILSLFQWIPHTTHKLICPCSITESQTEMKATAKAATSSTG
jgi:hypothetical protein